MSGSVVNWDSLLAKSMRATLPEVESVLHEVITKGAKQYVGILVDEMRSRGAPSSVIKTAASLTPGEPDTYEFLSHKTGWYGKGRAEIELSFGDDQSRPSFTGDQVDNIVALFDTGYDLSNAANHLPAGEWHGSYWVAKRHRGALNYMPAARRRAKQEIEGLFDIVAQ